MAKKWSNQNYENNICLDNGRKMMNNNKNRKAINKKLSQSNKIQPHEIYSLVLWMTDKW